MAEIDWVLDLINTMADIIGITHRRALALQKILEDAQLTTAETVAAKMQALDDASTVEVEFAPEYEEFRRIREKIYRRIAEGPNA
jgi:arylsulfatase A-like enzyme